MKNNNLCAISIKLKNQDVTGEQYKALFNQLAEKKSKYWELYGADVQYVFDIKDGKNRAYT